MLSRLCRIRGRLTEAQERAAAEQERQRRQQERQQWVHQALTEQREHFGPGLQQPFEAHDVGFFLQGASVFRFAVRYLARPPQTLLNHFEKNNGHVLVARRCWHCNRPILCLDASEYIGEFRIYSPWVEYFRPPEGDRGYLISTCQQCGKRQRRRGLYEGRYVMLDGRYLATWLAAFLPAAEQVGQRPP